MKRDENKPFLIGILIGIIVIGGIAIFPIIIELNKPKPIEPILYIAIDDTFYKDWGTGEQCYGNRTYIRIGENGGYGLLKFDLTNKPKEWNNLEVSFRIMSNHRAEMVYIQFLCCNWNESMTCEEIRDEVRYPNPDWQTASFREPLNASANLGKEYTYKFDIIHYLNRANLNITSCLNDYDSITVLLKPYDPVFTIYSKEADITIDKLPQLIWS